MAGATQWIKDVTGKGWRMGLEKWRGTKENARGEGRKDRDRERMRKTDVKDDKMKGKNNCAIMDQGREEREM